MKAILKDDGSVEVDFSDAPVTIDGTAVKKLVMREPTVGDQLAAQKISEGPAGEVHLIANLAEISPEAIRAMSMRHYRRLQDGLALFMD